jgi:SAM-dependent methyltransferase
MALKDQFRSIGRRLLPLSSRRLIVRLTRWPPVGWVNLGDLRRLTPIRVVWGAERGQPIDRYYIERFLAEQAEDIRGRVLEIGEDRYTRAFGGQRVSRSDVLHVARNGPPVTMVGDLTQANSLPPDAFDCIILTQTLQAIYDVPAAIRTVYRALKPGGVALVTIPGISKISRYDMDRWGYCWSFTSYSARRLFELSFPEGQVHVATSGNVLAATAFLYGLATQELKPAELNFHDPDFELLVTIRARKLDVAA